MAILNGKRRIREVGSVLTVIVLGLTAVSCRRSAESSFDFVSFTPPSSEFTVDNHTLFLHHFNDRATTADFAQGPGMAVQYGPTGMSMDHSPAMGPQLADGKFSSGGYFSSTSPGLCFLSLKNYLPERGTIEFFVRPDPSQAPGIFPYWTSTNRQPLFRGAPLSDLQKAPLTMGLQTNQNPDRGLRSDLFAKFNTVKSSATELFKGETVFHHLALCWDTNVVAFFIDGHLVKSDRIFRLRDIDGFVIGHQAGAVIDEFRISNIARYIDGVPKPDAAPQPVVAAVRIGSPQLFVDNTFIDAATPGFIRKIGRPVKAAAPVLRPDPQNEGPLALPFSGGVFRPEARRWILFYQTYRRWMDGPGRTTARIAHSADGVSWRKEPNNVVIDKVFDSFSVVWDPVKKSFIGLMSEFEGRSIRPTLHRSADGKQWQPVSPTPILEGAGDRMSLWLDEQANRFGVFTRFGTGGRQVWQSTSEDLATWTEPTIIFEPTEIERLQDVEHYGATAFRYGDMMLGFLEVIENRHKRVHTQLIGSRDGRTWFRIMEGERFLDVGGPDSFDEFWAFPAATAPILVGDELYIHYAGRSHMHYPPNPPSGGLDKTGRPMYAYGGATGLAKLRKDGFVYLQSSGEDVLLLTPPIQIPGTRLSINADARNAPAGSSRLRVAVLTDTGAPFAGLGLADSREISSDQVRHDAQWTSRDLTLLKGKTARLLFLMRNTRLYSFTFEE